jgi:hypothetical protein
MLVAVLRNIFKAWGNTRGCDKEEDNMDRRRFFLSTGTGILGAAINRAVSGEGPAIAQKDPDVAEKLFPVFSCAARNDLYQVLKQNGVEAPRYSTPEETVRRASPGAGVLILAEGYPEKTTPLAPALFEEAGKKKLRLYVEYPSMLPGLALGPPRDLEAGLYGNVLDRTVVASDAFGIALRKMRILMISDCHFLPVKAENPHLVVARVEGYNTAVLGLPKENWPILFEDPQGNVLVATTKLSQFVTGRYAPQEAWGPVWRMILSWLQPGRNVPLLKWTPTVRPSYARAETLPADAEFQAIRRGSKWFKRSKLLVHASWNKGLDFGKRGGLPADWIVGDGEKGIIEGYNSKRIFLDGTQGVNADVRADCNAETAMGLAFGAALSHGGPAREISAKLIDFNFFNSPIAQGPRANPASPSYGLIGGGAAEASVTTYWGDDNARCILGTITSAALLNFDRWDEPILRAILANFRTTGPRGFRPLSLNETALQKNGWQYYWNWPKINYSGHFQSWLWCTYLWLYQKTKFPPLLERARTGLRMMMEAYPNWQPEANRPEADRARMLLPLAWLIRVDDTPDHREWLRQMARYVLTLQHASGAIPQRVAKAITSNAAYGTSECALVHESGDPAADMLYTDNFAFIGLHEAAAVLRDPELAQAEKRLADFLIRIQTRSEAHSELDGAWYRCFDFEKWDYWGSDGDLGWGVWSIETGWTQGWIVSTLALREMRTSLWEVTATSKIARYFEKYRGKMLPAEIL